MEIEELLKEMESELELEEEESNFNSSDSSFDSYISFIQRVKDQKNELDRLGSKWLSIKTKENTMKLDILRAERELKNEQKKLEGLMEKVDHILNLENEINDIEEKLRKSSQRVEDQVIILASRVRSVQRQLLESYKNDINSLFIDIDQMITNQTKPMLEKIGCSPNLIPKACVVCAREKGEQNSNDTFSQWIAMIPCGHQFCQECAEYANDRLKCHLCNQIPDGILSLY